MAFEEPTILVRLDRTYNDKAEALQLEQGEYNGSPTFSLRVIWQTDDEQWRWSQKRADKNGKFWDSLNIKAKELKELGEAMIKAANECGGKTRSRTGGAPTGQQRRAPSSKEQRELDKFDSDTGNGRAAPSEFPDDDDSDIPF